MAITYKIDDKLVITFDINEAPVVQPTWPDGTPFKDKAEAEKWAKTFIGYLKDETAPQPGNSPDAPTLKEEDLVDFTAQAELEAAVAEEKKLAEEAAAKFEEELRNSEKDAAAPDSIKVLIEIPKELGSEEDIVDAEIVDEK